jgi:hypothetical protein
VAGRADGFGLVVKQQPADKDSDDKTEVQMCTLERNVKFKSEPC